MLFYHVLAGAPLHLARVLDGDDLLVQDLLVEDALRGRVDAIVAVSSKCKVQVLDVKASCGSKTTQHFIVDVLE